MGNELQAVAAELAKEVADGNFQDARLTERLARTLVGVMRDPAAGLPSVLSAAELEGAYRFFSNPLVTPEQVLAPHMEATRVRCAQEKRVRVVHDTTEFAYRRDGKRAGFDDEDRAYQAFRAHVSLALSSTRQTLGVVGLLTWPRGPKRTTPEHACWLQQIRASARLLEGCRPIHIADAGADDYALFSSLIAEKHRFVIRSAYDRWTTSGDGVATKLHTAVAKIEHVIERPAKLNARKREVDPKKRATHAPREPRTTTLHIAATAVTFPRPPHYGRGKKEHLGEHALSLTLNVVRVWEPAPPDGAVPIEWLLLTNESIETVEQIEAVVDDYRARWTVEEFFKALKTGCAFEKRQLQDYESLVNALAVFLPIACKMLTLRTQARVEPNAPAATVVTVDELEVLRALGRRMLPEQPTARDVLLAIAALGGHIKYAPDPGWLTIARGYEKLDAYVAGWRAAKLQQHSDQR